MSLVTVENGGGELVVTGEIRVSGSCVRRFLTFVTCGCSVWGGSWPGVVVVVT